MPPRAPKPAGPLDAGMLSVLLSFDGALDPTDPESLAHAVRDFQGSRGLVQTGDLDEATLGDLRQAAAAAAVDEGEPDRRDLARGATGQAVMDLQRLIVAPLTGDFDADTERRVRRVQSAAGLPVTGVVDAATWAAAEAKTKS